MKIVFQFASLGWTPLFLRYYNSLLKEKDFREGATGEEVREREILTF